MGAFIGTALLARLVAVKAGVSVSEAEKVINAYNEVVVTLLNEGGKVRALGAGHLEVIEKKATRRRNPQTERLIKVPAKKKIIFRETRKK